MIKLLGKKQNALSTLLVALILLSTNNCMVRHEPDKVWNLRGKMMILAKNLTGLAYRYGGNEIDGFDCSGFVYYVYDSFGVDVPRTAKKQGRLKPRVKLKHAKPADILVFKLKGRYHTGLYTGNGSFIHAPNKKSRVREEQFNKFWKRKLKYAVQIIKE